MAGGEPKFHNIETEHPNWTPVARSHSNRQKKRKKKKGREKKEKRTKGKKEKTAWDGRQQQMRGRTNR